MAFTSPAPAWCSFFLFIAVQERRSTAKVRRDRLWALSTSITESAEPRTIARNLTPWCRPPGAGGSTVFWLPALIVRAFCLASSAGTRRVPGAGGWLHIPQWGVRHHECAWAIAFLASSSMYGPLTRVLLLHDGRDFRVGKIVDGGVQIAPCVLLRFIIRSLFSYASGNPSVTWPYAAVPTSPAVSLAVARSVHFVTEARVKSQLLPTYD
jgi:hypothetical protein